MALFTQSSLDCANLRLSHPSARAMPVLDMGVNSVIHEKGCRAYLCVVQETVANTNAASACNHTHTPPPHTHTHTYTHTHTHCRSTFNQLVYAINQSTTPINQANNQLRQSTKQAINYTNQSSKQAINQSLNQSTNPLDYVRRGGTTTNQKEPKNRTTMHNP